MQTTDPRRTPRPDSEERTPKQGAAARPLPVNRRAPQRRGPNQSMLVFAAQLAVIPLGAAGDFPLHLQAALDQFDGGAPVAHAGHAHRTDHGAGHRARGGEAPRRAV